ncbi:nSTAND1 domain-containing NTPase [Tautonia plasticadhaerens]|uniref:Caspase domain protein n=1 Tax=Tautonia plasticadhaerens TaxID=2527974 RepID=A0A518H976_9BACT|nr:caspase family protein [Tautonia plasticadhaerens]QDV37393.1 Caspase domain protein [Tautonia plasticadhaerens]
MRQYFRNGWGLVIGVDRYSAPIRPLSNAVRDAEAIAAELRNHHGFDRLELWRNDEATRGRLEDHLSGLATGGQIGPDDRMLLYFAGHGVSLRADRDQPAGRILLADADAGDTDTFFDMRTLHRLLQQLPGRHLLVVLDCCFAGTFRFGARDLIPARREPLAREWFRGLIEERACQLLVSTAHDQPAIDTIGGEPIADRDRWDPLSDHRSAEAGRHSPFANSLLRALRGEADLNGDGVITSNELVAFLEAEVARIAGGQLPQLWPLPRHGNGQFLFFDPSGSFFEEALRPVAELVRHTNPFLGERAFEEGDDAVFFGRDQEVERLANQVGTNGVVLLTGPSGSGKTSLLRAGLIPEFLQRPYWHVVAPDSRGLRSSRDLSIALAGALPGDGEPAGEAEGRPDPPADPAEVLRRWLERHADRRLFLILDDPRPSTDAEAEPLRASLDRLAALPARFRDRFRLVLAHREDRPSPLGTAAVDPARFELAQPPGTSIQQIMRRSLEHAALFAEPPSLIDDLGDRLAMAPGGLAACSITMRDLCERTLSRQPSDRHVRAGEGGASGAIEASLSRLAEDAFAELCPPGTGEETALRLRHALLRLVVPVDGGFDAREASAAEFEPRAGEGEATTRRVIATLVDRRLLVRRRSPTGRGSSMAMAHGGLIRWGRLATWAEQARDSGDFALRDVLRSGLETWKATGRASLSAPDRSRIERRLRGGDDWFSREEWRFIDASRRQRRLFLGTLAAGATAGLMSIPAVQLGSVHLDVAGPPPQAVLLRRGRRWLDWLPGPLGPSVRFDTGLTAAEFAPERREEIEVGAFRGGSHDEELLGRVRPHLLPAARVRILCMIADWSGLRSAAFDAWSGQPDEEREDVAGEIDRRSAALPPAAFGHLIDAFEQSGPEVQAAGLRAMSRSEGPIARRVARVALGLLNAADPDGDAISEDARIEAVHALEAIGLRGEVDPIPSLVEALKGEDGLLASESIGTLSRLAPPLQSRLVDRLAPLLESRDSDLTHSALLALGGAQAGALRPIVPTLEGLLDHDTWFVSQEAALVLTGVGLGDHRRLGEFARSWLGEDDPTNRARVIQALTMLSRLPPDQSLPAFKRLSELTGAEDPEIAARDVECLVRLGGRR